MSLKRNKEKRLKVRVTNNIEFQKQRAPSCMGYRDPKQKNIYIQKIK